MAVTEAILLLWSGQPPMVQVWSLDSIMTLRCVVTTRAGKKALEQVQVPDSDVSTKLTICQNAIIDGSEFGSPAPLAVFYNGS